MITPDEDAAAAEDAAFDETGGVGDDSSPTDVAPGDDGTADAHGEPLPDPIRYPESYSGDDMPADTRHFQIVVAAVQGILTAAPGTGPEALATRALQYADAVVAALDAPKDDE